LRTRTLRADSRLEDDDNSNGNREKSAGGGRKAPERSSSGPRGRGFTEAGPQQGARAFHRLNPVAYLQIAASDKLRNRCIERAHSFTACPARIQMRRYLGFPPGGQFSVRRHDEIPV